MGRRGWTATATALGAGMALRALGRRARAARTMDFAGAVVAITGGSRGLGLVLAREFAAEGARLAILARDAATLEEARRELAGRGAEVFILPCDVGDRAAVQGAIGQIIARYGRLDVLVNNAGIIQAGPLDHMTPDDFADALAVHFWGPFYAINAALPAMRRQGGGRIVNIASIGGRLAVPHLAPYSASKFALVGLSDALRAELARDNIRVTTVSPGLLRTGSPPNALFKGRHAEEYRWFAILGAFPLASIDARRAARQIVAACRHGDPELTITWQARAATIANTLLPDLTARLTVLVNGFLPAPAGAGGDRSRRGWQSESALAPSPLTALSDEASVENNELVARRGIVTEGVTTMADQDGRGVPQGGATGPTQPSQAEGDRETVEAALREQPGDDRAGQALPATDGDNAVTARDPRNRPSQAEGEREPGE